jgi:hypothetical protein
MNRILSSMSLAPKLLVAGLLFSALALLSGCGGELDPSDPKDAYSLFRTALFSGDADTAWTHADEQTRHYFQERYEKLQEMNDLIERYLPYTDHQIARSQSGVELLDELESGQDLFTLVFKPAEFIDDPSVSFGAEAREIQMSESGDTARVVTRGEQEFVLVLQDDDLWYVNLVESGDFLDDAFQWLSNNEDALEQTVQDLIEEERRNREEIISQLMNVDDD